MLKKLDEYDWQQAFEYAKGFTREDVAEILYMRLGENDEFNWLLAARLTNGQFAYLSAGCDYTGWD